MKERNALILVAVLWAVTFAVGMLGLVALRNQQAMAEREQASVNWMPLRAKVLSVSVRPVEHARPLRPKFTRRINYGYSVDGVQYTSTRFSFAGDQLFRTRAEAQAAKPGEGDPIEIYFDPAKPNDAIVERVSRESPDAPRFKYGMTGLALFEGILLISAVRFLRRRRKRRTTPALPRGSRR